jgi:exopolysaccharide biosynthesis polyprenyl glycosylphosphotransferase
MIRRVAATPVRGRSIPLAPITSANGTGAARALDRHAWSRFRLLIDVVVLYLAAISALFGDASIWVGQDRWIALSFPLIVLAIMHNRRSSDSRPFGSLVGTSAQVLGVVSLSAMLTIALFAITGGPRPVGTAFRLWLFSVLYLGAARAVLLLVRRQALRTTVLGTPTLIVGAGLVGEHLVKRLVGEPQYGLRPVGYLDGDPLPKGDRAATGFVPVLGGPDDLADAVQRTGARHVILAFSAEPDHILVGKVRQCQQLGVDVSVVPRLYESINERATLAHVGGLPLVSLRPTNPRGWQFLVKHALDRSFALLALVMLSPLMVAIAVAVRFSSPGPILFRQRRVGRDGHEFDLWKFRTMRESAGEAQDFELPDGLAPGGVEGEDRRTRIGRHLRDLALDELPQFINVLRGDMSIVGPRPERPEYVERFAADVSRYEDRHRVKSGITGCAQVIGLRGQTSIVDRVEWDNYYIQNWSLGLDLQIIASTFAQIWRACG